MSAVLQWGQEIPVGGGAFGAAPGQEFLAFPWPRAQAVNRILFLNRTLCSHVSGGILPKA